jgi:hypothetical protein
MRPTIRIVLLGVGAVVAAVAIASPALAGQDRGEAARARPLLTVLRELAADGPVDLRIDPAVADRAAEVGTPSAGFEIAIKEALLSSGVDFVMAWRNGRLQVRAGDLHAAVDVTAKTRPSASIAESAPEMAVDPGAVPARDAAQGESSGPEGTPQETDPGADSGAGVSGEGTVTGEQLVALLAAPASAVRGASPIIELPFTDANGRPVQVARPTTPRTAIELPFTDATGQPVIQPVGPSNPGVIELPFPDANGQPIRLTAPPGGASARRPGGR